MYGENDAHCIFISNEASFPHPIPSILPKIPDRPKGRFFKAHKFTQFTEDQKFKTVRELVDAFVACEWDLTGRTNAQPIHMLIEAALDELNTLGIVAYEHTRNMNEAYKIPELMVIERHVVQRLG